MGIPECKKGIQTCQHIDKLATSTTALTIADSGSFSARGDTHLRQSKNVVVLIDITQAIYNHNKQETWGQATQSFCTSIFRYIKNIRRIANSLSQDDDDDDDNDDDDDEFDMLRDIQKVEDEERKHDHTNSCATQLHVILTFDNKRWTPNVKDATNLRNKAAKQSLKQNDISIDVGKEVGRIEACLDDPEVLSFMPKPTGNAWGKGCCRTGKIVKVMCKLYIQELRRAIPKEMPDNTFLVVDTPYDMFSVTSGINNVKINDHDTRWRNRVGESDYKAPWYMRKLQEEFPERFTSDNKCTFIVQSKDTDLVFILAVTRALYKFPFHTVTILDLNRVVNIGPAKRGEEPFRREILFIEEFIQLLCRVTKVPFHKEYMATSAARTRCVVMLAYMIFILRGNDFIETPKLKNVKIKDIIPLWVEYNVVYAKQYTGEGNDPPIAVIPNSSTSGKTWQVMLNFSYIEGVLKFIQTNRKRKIRTYTTPQFNTFVTQLTWCMKYIANGPVCPLELDKDGAFDPFPSPFETRTVHILRQQDHSKEEAQTVIKRASALPDLDVKETVHVPLYGWVRNDQGKGDSVMLSVIPFASDFEPNTVWGDVAVTKGHPLYGIPGNKLFTPWIDAKPNPRPCKRRRKTRVLPTTTTTTTSTHHQRVKGQVDIPLRTIIKH